MTADGVERVLSTCPICEGPVVYQKHRRRGTGPLADAHEHAEDCVAFVRERLGRQVRVVGDELLTALGARDEARAGRAVLEARLAHAVEVQRLRRVRLYERLVAANLRVREAEKKASDAVTMKKVATRVLASKREQVATLTANLADAQELRKLLREAVEDGIAECVNTPTCDDADEPMERAQWCQFCDLSARIAEHLA